MRPVQTYFNATLNIQAQWHSEPGTRGTFALLSSCLSTLFLCVWTAVHLNLPQHKKKHLQKWRKLQWLLIGAFAPEIVTWNAWEQRRQVKFLTREMQNLRRARHNLHGDLTVPDWRSGLKSRWNHVWRLYWLSRTWTWLKHMWQRFLVSCLIRPGDLPEQQATDSHHDVEEHGLEPHLWNDVHSWYAVMGGYAFELSASNIAYLPQDHERMVLTPDGLCIFYKYWPHLMPEISHQDIEDKSKSDELAKFLTCLQATWFCIQCISRFTQGLSVSLLEINTLAHAICSLVSYMFWWNKPKDLVEPTRIMGDEADAVATLLYTQSMLGYADIREENGRRSSKQARWLPCEHTAAARCVPEDSTVAVYSAENLTSPLVILTNDRYWCLDFLRSDLHERPLFVQVDRRTTSQLGMIQHHSELNDIDKGLTITNQIVKRLRLRKALVVWRSRNFSAHDFGIWEDRFDTGSWSAYWALLAYILGFSFASLLYASLHCIAWYGSFPSELEQTLWRTSCIAIALGGFMVAAFWSASSVLWAYAQNIELAADRLGALSLSHWRSYDISRKVEIVAEITGIGLFALLYNCIGWPTVFGLSVYCLGRIYLVVEGLRETFYLDNSVFKTTTWSQYVPHIA